jgi:cytochrome c
MLPHAQHTADEVHMMVRWIFALEKGKGSPALTRGLEGEVVAPKSDSTRLCILDASFTDAGRAPALPLTGSATVKLRSRRLEAEQADTITGPQTLGAGNAGGKKMLGATAHGHTLKFAGLNLADTGAVTLRASSAGSGGIVELRAGTPTGDLLASIEVKPTGAWEKWVELRAPLQAPPTARGDVFVVFVNPGKGGLMNLDWIQFEAR